MKPPEKLYEFHVENLRAIEVGLDKLALSLRHAISTKETKTVFSFTRLYAMMLGNWSECRLRKLLYEPHAFSRDEIQNVLAASTENNRWRTCVETAFRKRYQIPKAELSENTLDHSSYSRYSTLLDLIETDIRPVIELRNRLAHGQWVYPLNERETDVSQEHFNALKRENLLSLQFKRSLLDYMSMLIHDLVVSRETFERDFDRNYSLVVETRRNLNTRSYEHYKQQLISSYQRGQRKRKSSA